MRISFFNVGKKWIFDPRGKQRNRLSYVINCSLSVYIPLIDSKLNLSSVWFDSSPSQFSGTNPGWCVHHKLTAMFRGPYERTWWNLQWRKSEGKWGQVRVRAPVSFIGCSLPWNSEEEEKQLPLSAGGKIGHCHIRKQALSQPRSQDLSLGYYIRISQLSPVLNSQCGWTSDLVNKVQRKLDCSESWCHYR